MKKGLIVLGVAGLLAGSVALMAGGKGPVEDRAVADAVVENMGAAELSGQEQGPTSSGPPDLTPAVVQAVLEELKDVEANGGLLRIARRHGCSQGQVKLILQARNKRLSELAEVQAEPIEK